MKLVKVEWLDSCGPSEWTRLDELDNEVPVVVSVGFVLNEDEVAVTLVPHVMDKQEPRKRCGFGCLTIPRVAIVKTVELDEDGTKLL